MSLYLNLPIRIKFFVLRLMPLANKIDLKYASDSFVSWMLYQILIKFLSLSSDFTFLCQTKAHQQSFFNIAPVHVYHAIVLLSQPS